MLTFAQRNLFASLFATLVFAAGCGGGASEEPQSSGDQKAEKPATAASGSSGSKSISGFKPISLSGVGGSEGETGGGASKQKQYTDADVLKAMQPLQILLGTWRGITKKTYDDFKGVDEPNWIWDFKSDEKHPALVMTSDKSPYFREARITYLPSTEQFRLVTKDADGAEQTFFGTWKEEPRDVAGDNNKLQRTFKLEFLEQVEEGAKETWRVVFNQRENNRYLMELARQRGQGPFQGVDVVGTQREGTSFAVNDEDYGDKTCVISQGLGVTQVSHNGKSYWVCCSGCKAAFEEDPEKWIAKWEARQKEMEASK